jgi:hypothetical protein
VHEDMERDRFFTPQEAVHYGLIDRVLNGNGAAGRHDGRTWVPSSSSCRSGCRLTAPRRCRRSPTRTCAAHGGGRRGRPRRRGALPRAPGRLRARGLAQRGPMAVRAFNPTLAEHGYEPGGSVLETNTADLPFLVDSVSAELQARGLGIVRVLHPIVGTERSADGGIAASCIPAGRRRPSRSCTSSSTGAWRPRTSPTSRTPCARCWPTCAASCATSPAARARRVGRRGRARGRRALRGGRGGRGRLLPRVAGARQLHLPRRARLRAGRRCAARRPRLRPGPARRRGALGLRQARGRSRRSTPACASGRLGGELLLVSKTNRMSPVHRRVRMDYVGIRASRRRRDRRGGAHHRPLHDQGLRPAASRRPSCTASCSGSWPART